MGFHPTIRCAQRAPAYNPRERMYQSVSLERKYLGPRLASYMYDIGPFFPHKALIAKTKASIFRYNDKYGHHRPSRGFLLHLIIIFYFYLFRNLCMDLNETSLLSRLSSAQNHCGSSSDLAAWLVDCSVGHLVTASPL